MLEWSIIIHMEYNNTSQWDVMPRKRTEKIRKWITTDLNNDELTAMPIFRFRVSTTRHFDEEMFEKNKCHVTTKT